MTTLEIILIVFGVWFALMTMGIFTFVICRSKIKAQAELVKGHREIWMYYHDNYDALKDIFDNNVKEPLTSKQHMFLVMLFNHMELAYNMKKFDLLARTIRNKEDFQDIFTNNSVGEFWEKNRVFRDKAFARYIDKVILEK